MISRQNLVAIHPIQAQKKRSPEGTIRQSHQSSNRKPSVGPYFLFKLNPKSFAIQGLATF